MSDLLWYSGTCIAFYYLPAQSVEHQTELHSKIGRDKAQTHQDCLSRNKNMQ